MIKLVTILTKFIAITIAAILFTSCDFTIHTNRIKGSGHVTTENRNVSSDFKSIEISNALDLEVEQSDKAEIKVIADDNLQNEIVTKVENGVLIISCKYSNFTNVNSKRIIVKMPIIEELQASSASSIKSINMLKGTSINLHASSAANIDVAIEFDNVDCESSSAAEITVKGKSLKLNTQASSGSSINAFDLLVNEVTADVSSGSTTKVHPIVNLNAQASSGGDISYNKDPKSIQQKSTSGGSIHKE